MSYNSHSGGRRGDETKRRKFFTRKRYRTILGNNVKPECRVLVYVGGEKFHRAAEGDGPVDAFVKAMKKALGGPDGPYPEVDDVDIKSYQVKLPNGHMGSESDVLVTMGIGDEEEIFIVTSKGKDVIKASYRAFERGLRDYLRYRRQE